MARCNHMTQWEVALVYILVVPEVWLLMTALHPLTQYPHMKHDGSNILNMILSSNHYGISTTIASEPAPSQASPLIVLTHGLQRVIPTDHITKMR